MPILPFIDRPKVNLNISYYTPATVVTGTMASGDIDRYKQGVSVKTSQQAFLKLTPLLSSFGFPANVRAIINHSIEQTTFGDVRLFINSDNGVTILPYDDISTLRDPVAFLKDPGITAYPQVLLSPDWLNPGAMNGIIEPLSVRGTLAGASIESPFVAHTIRSSIMGPYLEYEVYESLTGYKYDHSVPFIDSQNIGMQKANFKIPGSPIADFGTKPIMPYDDSQRYKLINDLKIQDESIFNDSVGIGIISRKVSTTFCYSPGESVMRGKTGIRNVVGINSLAFGGLMR